MQSFRTQSKDKSMINMVKKESNREGELVDSLALEEDLVEDLNRVSHLLRPTIYLRISLEAKIHLPTS